MKTNLIFLTVLSVFPILNAYSQNQDVESAKNLLKYWNYRYRLIGDNEVPNLYPGFLKVGDGPGMSIPAARRTTHVNSLYHIFSQDFSSDPGLQQGDCYGKQPDVHNNNPPVWGLLQWGDGTIDLGFYIAVLATEWELLRKSGKDKTETENELYYALKAINRLDEMAETYYGMPASLNGFFIRDDVPFDFHTNFSSDYNMVASDICGDPSYGTDDCDYRDVIPGSEFDGYSNSMSQDQVIGLLFGLRFIAKFIPASTVVNGMNLLDEARNITTRMINYVKQEGLLNEWVIKAPNDKLVCRGPFAIAFSWAIAKAGKEITGEDFQNVNSTLMLPLWLEIENEFNKNPGTTIDLCYYGGNLITTMLFNLSPINPPISICIAVWDWDATNLSMIFKLAAITGSWSQQNLTNNGYYADRMIYSLAHDVLYDLTPRNSVQFMPIDQKSFWEQEIFNTAPCAGPCYDDGAFHDGINKYDESDCNPVDGWKSAQRWKDPQEKDAGASNWGEYPGLDYMLAYNLYRLAYWDVITWPPYDNIWDREISGDYPLNLSTSPSPLTSTNNINVIIGDDANPMTYGAIRNLTVTGHAYPDANVIFKAGKTIDVVPLFETEMGAEINFIPELFQCDVNYIDLGSGSYVVAYKKSAVPSEDASQNGFLDSTEYFLEKNIRENKIFQVTPNPNKGKFTIDLKDGYSGSKTISVENVLGQTIYKTTTTESKTAIDISHFSKGIYNVRITSDRKLFVKQILYQ